MVIFFAYALDDGPYEIEVPGDLYIEAAAPCKVTFSLGKQYVNYAKKMPLTCCGTKDIPQLAGS